MVAPSIQDLRKFQWGRETVHATATLTIPTLVTAGDKMVIAKPVEDSIATAGSVTSLTDSTKNWIVNQFAGYILYLNAGTNSGQFYTIVSNTSTVLTFATGLAPDNTSEYLIFRAAQVYTFLASGANDPGEINIGVNAAASQANIIAALDGSDGWNITNPDVNAAAFSTNVSALTADVQGTYGNSIQLIETFTAVGNVFSAGLMSGGVDRGTLHAATSVMLVANWDAEPTDNMYHPPLLRGIIQRWKGGEIVVERGTKWTIPETPFFYEQAHHLGLMAVRGGVAAVGAGPTYAWTFLRDPTGNPDLDSFTIERRLSDGINFIDQRCGYNLISQITWKAAQNQPIMYTAEGFGRRINNGTFTAGQSAPTGVAALGSASKVYMDNAWSGLGGTQIQGQILNWEIMFMTGYAPLFTTDGRTDLDFTIASLSSENTQLNVKLTMLVKPGVGGQFALEQQCAENATLRAMRIQADGADGRQVQWDMMLKHNLGSLFKVGEFEGQDIVEMELVESTDGSHLFQMKVTNLLNALT